MANFLLEAKEHEATLEDLMQRFDSANQKWLVTSGKKIHGYCTVSLQKTIYGTPFVLVENLYVGKKARSREALRSIEKAVVDWTQLQGIKQIMFSTRRNAKAFIRLLKTRFTVDSLVLSACV